MSALDKSEFILDCKKKNKTNVFNVGVSQSFAKNVKRLLYIWEQTVSVEVWLSGWLKKLLSFCKESKTP